MRSNVARASGKESPGFSHGENVNKVGKAFHSPKDMLQWQYRSILEELNELQRHASDSTCPCVLADHGEYCLQKHALGLHTLAKETSAMDESNLDMLEQLADEALAQHTALKDRIVCGKQHKDEKDTVDWARQWRKKLEPLYYSCSVKKAKVKEPVATEDVKASGVVINLPDAGTFKQVAGLKEPLYIKAYFHNPDKKSEFIFMPSLLDTGSARSGITSDMAEEIGLKPLSKQPRRLADGTRGEGDVARCLLKIGKVTLPSIIWIDLGEPIIGHDDLQVRGFMSGEKIIELAEEAKDVKALFGTETVKLAHMFPANLAVSNNPKTGFIQIPAVVDTGGDLTRLPMPLVEKLKLKRVEGHPLERVYDGIKWQLWPVFECYTRVKGRQTPDLIWGIGTAFAIGAHTLELLHFVVNPMIGKLEPRKPAPRSGLAIGEDTYQKFHAPVSAEEVKALFAQAPPLTVSGTCLPNKTCGFAVAEAEKIIRQQKKVKGEAVTAEDVARVFSEKYRRNINRNSLTFETQESDFTLSKEEIKTSSKIQKYHKLGQEMSQKYNGNLTETVYGEDLDFLGNDNLAGDSFDRGFKGKSLPDVEIGWRYGAAPESGYSMNFKENIPERGVSMMASKDKLGNLSQTQDLMSRVFLEVSGRDIYVYRGFRFGNGSDGEPILKIISHLETIKKEVLSDKTAEIAPKETAKEVVQPVQARMFAPRRISKAEWERILKYQLPLLPTEPMPKEVAIPLPSTPVPAGKGKFALFGFQQECVAWLKGRSFALLADEMGLGKSQPIDSHLLTPSGWVEMGAIKLGDEVYGSDGKSHEVLGVYPQGEIDVYRVTFTDGSIVDCSLDHLWTVNSALRKYQGYSARTFTLKEIIEHGLKDANGNTEFFVSMVLPIQFNERDLPLHPYVLGVLLGDGYLAGGTILISTADVEILDKVAVLLPVGMKLVHKSEYDYRVVTPGSSGSITNPVKNIIKDLALRVVSSGKFIPEQYKYSSVSQRLDLLRGLMDTDGYVSKDGIVVQFSSVSEKLADDVQFIVESLGGKATKSSKIPSYSYKGEKRRGKLSYTLNISMTEMPFSLKRKADLVKPRTKYLPFRGIEKVEKIGTKPCQCVAVDSADQLYVTDHCVLTHNTPQGIHWGAERRPALVVVPAALTLNWQREIKEMWRPDDSVLVLDGKVDLPSKLPDWTILSYGMLNHYLRKLRRAGFRAIIIDEAHLVKNQDTQRTRNILNLVAPVDPEPTDKPIPNRLAVTGTPIVNRPIELFPLLVFLGVKPRDDYKDFLENYTSYIVVKGRMVFKGAKNLRQLHDSLKPFMLRRMKKDVLKQLPPKLNTPLFVPITNASEYREAEG